MRSPFVSPNANEISGTVGMLCRENIGPCLVFITIGEVLSFFLERHISRGCREWPLLRGIVADISAPNPSLRDALRKYSPVRSGGISSGWRRESAAVARIAPEMTRVCRGDCRF